MAVAIVTGASRGIGLEISKRLVARGYTTFGLARNFEICSFQNKQFHPTVCDITDVSQLCVVTNQIIREQKRIDVLVNNAGIGIFGPLDTLDAAQIEQMVKTNLTAPLILTSQLLFWLRKSSGYIINISSIAGIKIKPHGAVYSATKAALNHFGDCLFEEARKQGVRVTTICPDITQNTGFYNTESFEPTENEDTYILPSCVADAVEQILNQRPGTVITSLVVQPQRFQITKRPRIS